MKKILSILAALAVVSLTAQAAGTSAQASWTAPTAYTDGTALPATDIAYYTIAWTPVASGGPKAGSLQVTAPATSATIPVACGGENFTVTVTTTATATYPNATSESSAIVPYASGVTCAPNPPGALTVH